MLPFYKFLQPKPGQAWGWQNDLIRPWFWPPWWDLINQLRDIPEAGSLQIKLPAWSLIADWGFKLLVASSSLKNSEVYVAVAAYFNWVAMDLSLLALLLKMEMI